MSDEKQLQSITSRLEIECSAITAFMTITMITNLRREVEQLNSQLENCQGKCKNLRNGLL